MYTVNLDSPKRGRFPGAQQNPWFYQTVTPQMPIIFIARAIPLCPRHIIPCDDITK